MDYIRQIERQSEQCRVNKTASVNKPLNRQESTQHVSRSIGPKPKAAEVYSSKTPAKCGLLGSKRGASSPNLQLPGTSRQNEETSVPLAKIHRNGLLGIDTY
jgi:hypothetical protein